MCQKSELLISETKNDAIEENVSNLSNERFSKSQNLNVVSDCIQLTLLSRNLFHNQFFKLIFQKRCLKSDSNNCPSKINKQESSNNMLSILKDNEIFDKTSKNIKKNHSSKCFSY